MRQAETSPSILGNPIVGGLPFLQCGFRQGIFCRNGLWLAEGAKAQPLCLRFGRFRVGMVIIAAGMGMIGNQQAQEALKSIGRKLTFDRMCLGVGMMMVVMVVMALSNLLQGMGMAV